MEEFGIEKPKLPIVLWLLIILVVFGLIALGVASFHAFLKVSPWYQALFAAILIEAGMVVEAITIIRKNWFSIIGVIISLIVSITYNYIQAEQAGKISNITNSWQLLTLAVGPLSALFSLALTIGDEIKKYDKSVLEWEEKRLLWVKEQESKRIAEEEKRRNDQQEKDKIEREFQLQKEKMVLQNQAKIEIARLRNNNKEKIISENSEEKSEKFSESYRKDFRKLSKEEINKIAFMSTKEIESAYNLSDRTARNWKKKAEVLVNTK